MLAANWDSGNTPSVSSLRDLQTATRLLPRRPVHTWWSMKEKWEGAMKELDRAAEAKRLVDEEDDDGAKTATPKSKPVNAFM